MIIGSYNSLHLLVVHLQISWKTLVKTGFPLASGRVRSQRLDVWTSATV